MTDQSKIPLPEGEGRNSGKSLLERATKVFDLAGFRPASVPDDLPAPTGWMRSRGTRRFNQSHEEPEQASSSDPEQNHPPELEDQTTTVTVPAVTPLLSAPAKEQAVQPIHFSGAPQAVNRAWLREQGYIEPEGAVTALLEEFRIIKRQLLQISRQLISEKRSADGQRILICSPHPGEGKTFCAVNLALSIAAERDSEVLLVDADFAKPSVLSALGLPGGAGLMDALADPKIKVEDCVLRTDVPGLWVLPAGNRTNSDSEYLASSRAGEVLDRLTQGVPGRIVIFDSPPALAASPAAELAKYVGQAVVVVRADRTGQSALEDAVSLLAACPDIKLLLNGAHFSPSGRRFGSYYGYGG
jgi:exopolysaccharide/PEP-CTERM locus tyrosine autokinase